ncbi:MAG: hypothetical protein ACM32E_10425 [Gemmatimonadota bacterium]
MPEAGAAAAPGARPAAGTGADPRARPGAAALRRALLAAGPPAAALLAANLLWLTAAQASRHNYLRSRLWVRYDSLHYLQIAGHGYTFMSCAGHSLHYGKGYWCGDAGWFPGYPALIWVLGRLGLPGPDAGVVISSAAGLAMLALLWNGFLVQRRDASSLLALGMAAFFFGQVYQRAVFPISLELFLLLAVIWLAARRRWVAAGLAGAAAAFTYSTGFLVALAVATWVLADRQAGPVRSRAAAAALTGGLSALGVAAVLVVQFLDTGVWGAFFRVQAKYHYHGLHPPYQKFLVTVRPLLHHHAGLGAAPAAQTLLAAVFCLSLVAVAAWHRGRLTAAERLVLSATLWFWLFPLCLGAGLDLYRSEALLVPAVVLARRLPAAVQVLFLLAMVPLAYAMSVLFFKRVLI